MQEQGFADLRLNRDSVNLHESFWPSFTDIMTVVVMIFMIASTVLILRNWELVQELRATMEAERVARERARTVTQTKETLEEQLTRAQYQLSELRLKLMQASELAESRGTQLAEQAQRILALESQGQQLESRLQSSERQNAMLSAQLNRAESEYSRLQGEKAALNAAYGQLQSQYAEQEQQLQTVAAALSQLEEINRTQLDELSRLRQARSEGEQQLTALQGEYADLKEKYDRLVRPARSAAGKHVVEVQYLKVDGDYRIRLRGPGEADYREVGSDEMHRRLSRLKERYPDSLYVKIILPENSGLSYNEAWRFTRDLLNKYDYYYED